MKQYSFLEESRLTYQEISRDPFMEKFFDVTGFIHEDCWSKLDWEKIVKSLKSEALMCSPSDTVAREKLDEVIIKCYYSGIPYLTSLSKEIGQYIIDLHDQNKEKNGKYHFTNAVLIGYMSLLASAIERYILKRHTWHDVYNCDMTIDPIKMKRIISDHKIGEQVQITWRSVNDAGLPSYDEKNRYGVIKEIEFEPGLYDPIPHAVYTVELNSGNVIQVTDDQIEDKKV